MENDIKWMRRALELARKGQGFVEPNPMVGCVLVRDDNVVGEGYHKKYGGPHAEVEAIRDAEKRAGNDRAANGTTCYVTLEPCSHYGKTSPCVEEIMESGIRRVVLAMRDPNPIVNGQGVEMMRSAGIEVVENVLEKESRLLNAPYLTRIEKKRPWIIGKWAMTLDGKLATRAGSSSWISNETSRKIVHRLRGRMDAILVGSGTAIHDDCSLTVRLDEQDAEDNSIPKRTPLRIVLNSDATISSESRLVRTAEKFPVLLVVGPEADNKRTETLRKSGCEIFVQSDRNRFDELFEYLVKKETTNLLVEGGGKVLGSLFEQRLIDEVHVFVAPKLIGGEAAPSPIAGLGLAEMQQATQIETPQIEIVGNDVYIHGRLRYTRNG